MAKENNKNWIWFGISAVILILAIFFISNSNNNSQGEVTCNSPYIKVGIECCLDSNNNGICDNDEADEEPLETYQKECWVDALYNSYTVACYDYRGEDPYITTAYCDSDVEVFERYECVNNMCEKRIDRQDCSKDLTNVKGWTCKKSDNPSQDGWMVTCTPK